MKISEIDELFEKCWKGYKKHGMKTMFGKRVPDCRKDESVELDENSFDFGPYNSIKQGSNEVLGTIDELDALIVKLHATVAEAYGDENDIPDEYEKPLKYLNTAQDGMANAMLHIIDAAKHDDVFESVELEEDLRAWFGKGKKGGAGGGGWDRYNTKGERVGKCGDSKKGEGKPKCLSKSRAASLRASGGKKAIANAVKRKKANDPNQNRRGKAKNVNSHPKK